MPRNYKKLLFPDRQIIESMGKAGYGAKDIAKAVGTHRDTIYKELKRTGTTLRTYDATAAQMKAWK